eukprot:5853747-Prymnesium_polylepis.1
MRGHLVDSPQAAISKRPLQPFPPIGREFPSLAPRARVTGPDPSREMAADGRRRRRYLRDVEVPSIEVVSLSSFVKYEN